GSNGISPGPRVSSILEDAPDDPLVAYSARATSFVSKGTGVISPGTYSTGVVRRKGVLKKIIRSLPGGTPRIIV
ncbi:unnamed protein product, partial [marine sediment metagenome]